MLDDLMGKIVLVRDDKAGVHVGTLAAFDVTSKSVTLKNARKVWYWNGAASVHGVAANGLDRKTSKVCPPLTTNPTESQGPAGSSKKGESRWPSIWFTAKNGFLKATAIPLAKESPSIKDVAKPGPAVAATASTFDRCTPPARSTASNTGRNARR